MQIIITKYHFSIIRIAKAESSATYLSKTELRQALLDNVGLSVNAYNPYKSPLANNNLTSKFIYPCPRYPTLENLFIRMFVSI